MNYVKIELNRAIQNEPYQALMVETPRLRRETLGNSYLLLAEGSQLLKVHGKRFAIRRGDVNTDTEYLTIIGLGDTV